MISTQNVSLRYGDRALFENVSVKFTEGNCYGIIGANGAGKSTFLKILAGEIEPNKGEVIIEPHKRLSVLKQDHFAYDENKVVETVIMGNKRLYEIMQEKERLYAKEDFNDEDGILLGELEGEFADMDGWNAEADAETMLNGLGITSEFHDMYMKDLDGNQKVKVLLAQALFGDPDILLLDEPTNHLDLKTMISGMNIVKCKFNKRKIKIKKLKQRKKNWKNLLQDSVPMLQKPNKQLLERNY